MFDMIFADSLSLRCCLASLVLVLFTNNNIYNSVAQGRHATFAFTSARPETCKTYSFALSRLTLLWTLPWVGLIHLGALFEETT